jgi:hypothetical protein
MLRLSDNPAPRWPADRPLADDQGQWWVALVKSRNEKALAWELTGLGVGYYLPMLTQRTIRRDNRKPRKSILCAFPGYISLTHYQERKADILRTGRIIKVIPVSDQEQFVRQMDQVQTALDQFREVGLLGSLAVGRRVMITAGPLQGVEGVIFRFSKPQKVFLNVAIFGRAVSVTIRSEERRVGKEC